MAGKAARSWASPSVIWRTGTGARRLRGALNRMWSAEHAPTSYASLVRPVPGEDIAAADGQLRQHFGYGMPAESTAPWRLCGGVKHQEIEGDEQEEVASGVFLPGGVVLPRSRWPPRPRGCASRS